MKLKFKLQKSLNSNKVISVSLLLKPGYITSLTPYLGGFGVPFQMENYLSDLFMKASTQFTSRHAGFKC